MDTLEKLNLIEFIKSCNQKYYKQLGYGRRDRQEDRENNEVTELQMHKILYFVYGYFYQKYQKELFQPNFYAYKYGPVELNYRKTKKEFTIDIDHGEKIFLKTLIDTLLGYSAYALVQKSHTTDPWIKNFNPDGNWKQMPNEEIKAYFLSLNKYGD